MEQINKKRPRSRRLCYFFRGQLSRAGERGAAAVEYGIMIATIAVVVLLAVVFLGHQTSNSFSCTASEVQTSSQC